MVDTPKKGNGDETTEMTPPRSNPSADVSGAALSPAKAKVVIAAQELIILRIVTKTTTIPSSKIQSRRREEPALLRERRMERRRMIITCPLRRQGKPRR